MFIFGQNKEVFAVISGHVTWFKVLQNGLLRYILYTCPNLLTRVQSATEWTASVHTLTHVQTCNVTRVQSASEWTASVHILHMSKPVM